MSSARDDMLERIRLALRDVPEGEEPEIPREYRRTDESPRESIVALFAERVADYRATVERLHENDLAGCVAAACRRHGATRLVVPADFPDRWLPSDIEIVRDDGLSPEDLDRAGGVITGCALGIALTGTIALDGGLYQGRRALTLIPDFHLCVVFEEQIVAIPPQAIARLHDAASDGRPITLISGPSATSDIELNRVEGVHGPRTLDVLVVSR